MVGKNNKNLRREKTGNKFFKYSIKRLSIGVASVATAAGISFIGQTVEVSAAENSPVAAAAARALDSISSEDDTQQSASDDHILGEETTGTEAPTQQGLASEEDQNVPASEFGGQKLGQDAANQEGSEETNTTSIAPTEQAPASNPASQLDGDSEGATIATYDTTDDGVEEKEKAPFTEEEADQVDFTPAKTGVEKPEGEGLGNGLHQNLIANFDGIGLASEESRTGNEIPFNLATYNYGLIGANDDVRLAFDDSFAPYIDEVKANNVVFDRLDDPSTGEPTNVWATHYSNLWDEAVGKRQANGTITLNDTFENVLSEIDKDSLDYRAYLYDNDKGTFNTYASTSGVIPIDANQEPNVAATLSQAWKGLYYGSASDVWFEPDVGENGGIIVDHYLQTASLLNEVIGRMNGEASFNIKVDERLLPYVEAPQLHNLSYNRETFFDRSYNPEADTNKDLEFGTNGVATYKFGVNGATEVMSQPKLGEYPSVMRVVIPFNEKIDEITKTDANGEKYLEVPGDKNVLPITTYFTTAKNEFVRNMTAYTRVPFPVLASGSVYRYEPTTVGNHETATVARPIDSLGNFAADGVAFRLSEDWDDGDWVKVNPDGSIELTTDENVMEGDYLIPVEYDGPEGTVKVRAHVTVENPELHQYVEDLRNLVDGVVLDGLIGNEAKLDAERFINDLPYLSDEAKTNFVNQLPLVDTPNDLKLVLEAAIAADEDGEDKLSDYAAALSNLLDGKIANDLISAEMKAEAEGLINELPYLTDEVKVNFVSQLPDADSPEQLKHVLDAAIQADADAETKLGEYAEGLSNLLDAAIANDVISSELKEEAAGAIDGLPFLSDKAKADFTAQLPLADTPEELKLILDAAFQADADAEANLDEYAKGLSNLLDSAIAKGLDGLISAEMKAEAEGVINDLPYLSDKVKSAFVKQLPGAATPEELKSILDEAIQADADAEAALGNYAEILNHLADLEDTEGDDEGTNNGGDAEGDDEETNNGEDTEGDDEGTNDGEDAEGDDEEANNGEDTEGDDEGTNDGEDAEGDSEDTNSDELSQAIDEFIDGLKAELAGVKAGEEGRRNALAKIQEQLAKLQGQQSAQQYIDWLEKEIAGVKAGEEGRRNALAKIQEQLAKLKAQQAAPEDGQEGNEENTTDVAPGTSGPADDGNGSSNNGAGSEGNGTEGERTENAGGSTSNSALNDEVNTNDDVVATTTVSAAPADTVVVDREPAEAARTTANTGQVKAAENENTSGVQTATSLPQTGFSAAALGLGMVLTGIGSAFAFKKRK